MYSTDKTAQQSSSIQPSANPDNLLLSATSQSLQIGPKPILRRPGRAYQKKNVTFTLPDQMELISHNPSPTGPYKLQPKKMSRPAIILPNGTVQRSDHRATGKGTLLLGALYDDSDDDDDSDDYNSGLLLGGEGGPMDGIKEEEMGEKEKEEEEMDEVTKQIVAMNEAKQRKQKQQAEQLRLEELKAAQPIPKQRAAAPFWASPNQNKSSRSSSSRSSLFSIGGGRR